MGMMGAKVFVDTNVLLRAVLKEMDGHAAVDARLKRLIMEDAELWISGQVIREFIVQVTHPKTLVVPLTMELVIHELNAIRPLYQVTDET
jgi:predicted nucleic acid-binding protein